jgi:formylglycine-generating enzyme required for sulfatase activity
VSLLPPEGAPAPPSPRAAAPPRPGAACVRGLAALLAIACGGPEPSPVTAAPPGPSPAPRAEPPPAPPLGEPEGQRVDYPMVLIPAGGLTMGSPPDEEGRNEDEAQHEVALSRPFLLGATEVTQALWRSVMGSNPSEFRGDDRPVDSVSWCAAVAFANRMSARDGLPAAYTGVDGCAASQGASVVWDQTSAGYRLPTEAEWEYAARAGQPHRYAGSDALDAVGWTRATAGGESHPVGQKAANAWGLHDMTGNVWEWCWDWIGAYGGSAADPTGPRSAPSRVNRGGALDNLPRYARVAFRGSGAPPHARRLPRPAPRARGPRRGAARRASGLARPRAAARPRPREAPRCSASRSATTA